MVNDCEEIEEDLVGSYFLELWRINSKRASLEIENENENEEDEDEDVPTELDTLNSSGGFSIVLPDKLTVKYGGVNLHGHDVGVVQANFSAPVKRLVYYFEIHINNAGAKGQIAIGFTPQGFNLRRQPGWEANSFGYHGDDGLIYRGQGKGEAFGPTYSTGDTVGGGINYGSHDFFFTKNGQVVGTVGKDVKGRLYPTISVHSQFEEVSVNFGKDPFLFDIKAYEAAQRSKQHTFIERVTIPQTASYGIVRSYLQHYGYEETLNVFDEASQSSIPPITGIHDNGFNEHGGYALKHRKILRKLIRDGQIDDAFAYLREWYPDTVQDDTSTICFMLHCQKFIELIRVGRLEESVDYGRTYFQKYYSMKEYEDLVKDCAALLAYEDPKKSSVGYLLEESQRENVADLANAIILSTNPDLKDHRSCMHSYLERLLRQLSACFLEKRLLNGNQGEAFHLRRLIRDGQIDDAFAYLREWYPDTVQDDTSTICFMLHCQKFIELIRVGRLEESVDYGRTYFQKYYSMKEYEDLVKDCAALLAYEDPKKSSVGYLLEESQRENVADLANAIILSTNPDLKDHRSCMHSYLERLLRQLSACFLEKRLLNGNQGEAFHLRRVLMAKNT